MKMTDFLFDSLYQIVTWVCIACGIASLFYFLSKGNPRGVVWSSVGLVCSVAIMIGLLAERYFSNSRTATQDRPYVFFQSTSLEPLAVGSKPVFSFILANSGQAEAEGEITDFTYYFAVGNKPQTFRYQGTKSLKFRLVPTERWTGQFRPDLDMTQDKLNALDTGQARLLFYGKMDYRSVGDSDWKYSQPWCRIYDPTFSNRLAICPDDTKIE